MMGCGFAFLIYFYLHRPLVYGDGNVLKWALNTYK